MTKIGKTPSGQIPDILIYPKPEMSFEYENYSCTCPFCQEYFQNDHGISWPERHYLAHVILKHPDKIDEVNSIYSCTIKDTRPEIKAAIEKEKQEEREKDKLIRTAIKKLTPKERKLLKLDMYYIKKED